MKSPETSHHRVRTAEEEEELHDLHLRLKMMVEADEEKNSRIERLEAENHDYKNLLAKVMHEIGAERLEELKDSKNGAVTPAKSNQPIRTNEVSPPSQSAVCVIL